MKTTLTAVFLSLFLSSVSADEYPLCKIVHDGDPGVRAHEVAHCWGWRHDEGNPNSSKHNPPAVPKKYLRMGEYPNLQEHSMVFGSVSRRCQKVTGENYSRSIFLRTVRGCSIGGL